MKERPESPDEEGKTELFRPGKVIRIMNTDNEMEEYLMPAVFPNPTTAPVGRARYLKRQANKTAMEALKKEGKDGSKRQPTPTRFSAPAVSYRHDSNQDCQMINILDLKRPRWKRWLIRGAFLAGVAAAGYLAMELVDNSERQAPIERQHGIED